MRRRSLLLAAAGLAAPLALGGLAQAQSGIPSMDELYQKAKAEGEVVFGGALKEEDAQNLLSKFQERYPGINVKYTRRATVAFVQLIEADKRANRVAFDVINLTEPADIARWRKENFLAAVPVPDTDKLLPETYDPKGYFYALGVTPMIGIYNTKSIAAGQAPKSLKELTSDPKWVGKLAISRPIRGGTNASALLNVIDAVGRDFLKTAKDRDILLTQGNEAAVSAVVTGERPVSWGVSGYRALEAKQDGAPIELIVWEEGVPLANFFLAIPEKAPHPNAARLLVRWLLSPEGQELIVKNARFYSTRKDVSVTPFDQPPLSAMKVNYESLDRLVNEGHALAVEYDRAVGLR